MVNKNKNTTKSTEKGQRSVTRALLAILSLLVFWFFIWLYDWQDELMSFLGKSKVLPSKATTGSTSGTNEKVLEFTTLQNTVVQRIIENDSDNYYHKQVTEEFVWDITHGLSRVTSVQCFDSAGKVVYPDIQNLFEQKINDKTGQPYLVVNQTILTFSEATAGIAVFT